MSAKGPTADDLERVLGSVEQRYQECWGLLCSLKQKPTPRIREFQPLLCDAMLQLSAEYNRINRERDRLISCKRSFNKSWFVARQRTLSARQTALCRARSIGQVLGDSFAWFFYQHEPNLLEKHAMHGVFDNLHAGIGGIGEREFLRNVPLIDGAMVLHHSTTSMLRIGDLSLVDLKTFRVTAIGELKTQSAGPNQLRISLTLIGETPPTLRATHTKEVQVPSTQLKDSKAIQRYHRQVGRMVSLLKTRQCPAPIQGIEEFNDRKMPELAATLSALKNGRFAIQRIDDGLMCLAYHHRRKSLYAIAVGDEPLRFDRHFDQLIPEIASLGIGGSPHNAIAIGTLLYQDGLPTHLLGAMPFFWWDIDLEVIRQVIFQEISIVTLFNPAHLVTKLERNGFQVNTSADGKEMHASVQNGDIRLEMDMKFYNTLIRQHLYSEAMVIRMLNGVAEHGKAQALAHGAHGKIRVKFHHALWRPPRSANSTGCS